MQIGRFEIPGFYTGDCRELLGELPDASINCCVTSPPYWGLRDYGADGQLGLEQTPEQYVANMVHVFEEVRRVLRDDGTLWLNLGDSYVGNASPGGENTRTCHSAPNAKDKIAITKTGDGLKPKDLVGIPWRVAFALQSVGWYLRSDIIWKKPNPMPESVTDRPTKAHEYIFLLSKSARYYYDADAIREDFSPASLNTERKTSGAAKRAALGDMARTTPVGRTCGVHANGRNKRDVWTVNSKPYPGSHFACFPPKLIEPCILAGCPLGGVVLDPFFGSGTTGQVAEDNGRKWIGFDINADYAKLQKARTAQMGLLGTIQPEG